MAKKLRIAIAQINPVVGGIEKNRDKIIEHILKARRQKSDIVVFPELALCGYPPEDLLLKKEFLKNVKIQLKHVIEASKSIFAIVGFPDYREGRVFNSAALIYDKKLIDVYNKMILPSYGVFDEARYFHRGNIVPIVPFGKAGRISISICEDIWHRSGPHKIAAAAGNADIIINISASPYHAGKMAGREKILRDRATQNKTFIAYCNMIGGQDELVFDGGSLIFSPKGEIIARAGQFREELLIADLNTAKPEKSRGRVEKKIDSTGEVYSALVMGLRDYVRKNGFKKIVLGLSGGIDSALTAKIASDALGPSNVIAVSMPSVFTSSSTRNDAKRLAKNLGIRLIVIPIDRIFKNYLSILKREFKGMKRDVAEENLQARIRGNMLMALSNKFGWLVVATGNKSEVSVGYCTLYGDTVGGFAVLKDVSKTMVYKLSEYANKKARFIVIPKSIIKRAPTAELKFKQKDQDTLPPYPILDKILDAYIEKDKGKEDIVKSGFNKRTVEKVVSMVDKNEYKRRQSPPGVKITPKAFGKDRRMPLVNRWKN